MLQTRCHRKSRQALLMQGLTELVLLGAVFLALQFWWLSKVFLFRPRQPRKLGKPMRANSLQEEKNSLQKIFDQS